MESLTNSINRMSVIGSEEEYSILEQSYITNCCDANVLQQAKRRYKRYINGIDDFTGFENIREMLNRYVNLDVINNTGLAFKLMQSIDSLLMEVLKQ